MNPRLEQLVRAAGQDGPRIGIISMYDVENNAVRILAATLRQAGVHVTEIYFKDWISNHIFPATDEELEGVIAAIREARLNLVCVSILASAYFNAARVLTTHIPEALDVGVL